VDLAVRQARAPFGAALDAFCLFRQDIIAVASPQLLEGQAWPVSMSTLSHLPKLHDAHDLWPEFLKALKTEDRSRNGLRLSQTALAIDAALSGQGVALVSQFLAARDIAAGNLVQVTTERFVGKQGSYPRAWCSFGVRRALRTEPEMDQLAAGRLMSGSSLIVAMVSSVM
jgi:LysR family glycine cleavage system transcriptional activator